MPELKSALKDPVPAKIFQALLVILAVTNLKHSSVKGG